jgi:FixJ family two-component response regulator
MRKPARRSHFSFPHTLVTMRVRRPRRLSSVQKPSEDLMNVTGLLLSVIDDDESVRESLPDLLMELGFKAEVFRSADAFLASGSVGRSRCIILDVAMPGMTGPDLHQELTRRGQSLPIVYITAQSDETMRRRLIKQGAVACLFKPFSDQALQEALRSALVQTRTHVLP